MVGSDKDISSNVKNLPPLLDLNNKYVENMPAKIKAYAPEDRQTIYIPENMIQYLTVDLKIPESALCTVDQFYLIARTIGRKYRVGLFSDAQPMVKLCSDEAGRDIVPGLKGRSYNMINIAGVRSGKRTAEAGIHHAYKDKFGEMNSNYIYLTHQACTDITEANLGEDLSMDDPKELNPNGVTIGVMKRKNQDRMSHACGAIGGSIELIHEYVKKAKKNKIDPEKLVSGTMDDYGVYRVDKDYSMCKVFTRLWTHKDEILSAPRHEQMYVAHEVIYQYTKDNLPEVLNDFEHGNVMALGATTIHMQPKDTFVPGNLMYVRDADLKLTPKKVDILIKDGVLPESIKETGDRDKHGNYLISLYAEFVDAIAQLKKVDHGYLIYDGELPDGIYEKIIEEDTEEDW